MAAPLPVDVLVVLGVVLLALVLFTTERIPVDLTAITVMVLLVVLEPWTSVTVAEGISGFSNPATVTVLAMLILSDGVRRTGLVQELGHRLTAFAGDDPDRQLLATVGVAGPASGFVNNTPVVAILVPVIADLAHQGNSSPSKLLMPLSFASMLGGTLTLIGTSTNILASDVAERTLGRGFGMFEFTGLGVIVLVVGSAYLLVVAPRLLPERVQAREDYIEEYGLAPYLAEVVVRGDSPLVGDPVSAVAADTDADIDVIQLERDGERVIEHLGRRRLRAGDRLKVRSDRDTLESLLDVEGLEFAGTDVTEAELEAAVEEQTLVELVIPAGSDLVGETLRSAGFRDRYDASVLAFRSRGELIHDRIDRIRLRVGDTLLIQATPDAVDRLAHGRDVIAAHEPPRPEYRRDRIPHALLIIAGVVGLPAIGVLPIVVSALAGVVAMALTGVLRPGELYDAVDWHIIFLLAGVIPLGIALDQSGGAAMIADLVAGTAAVLPAIGVLWVFYAATALLTNVVSNNASVVLMIPVAVEAAARLDANAFAFVLAVTFAASTAFMTPVGYQTNLFVYGPGGYRFTDFIRVGGPLQLLMSVVTVLGIAAMWGVA